MSRNYIEETTGLEELEGLRHLDLSKNSVVTVKELFYPLDYFYLSGNPLSLLVLEKLVRLDNDAFIIWVNDFSMDMAFYSDDGSWRCSTTSSGRKNTAKRKKADTEKDLDGAMKHERKITGFSNPR